MKEIVHKLYNYFFPVTGGSAGAILHVETSKATVLTITAPQTLEVIFYAAIGAVVGYLVKKGLDRLFKCKT